MEEEIRDRVERVARETWYKYDRDVVWGEIAKAIIQELRSSHRNRRQEMTLTEKLIEKIDGCLVQTGIALGSVQLFRKAILKVLKEAGLKFVPDGFELPETPEFYALESGKVGFKNGRNDTLKAIIEQIKGIDV